MNKVTLTALTIMFTLVGCKTTEKPMENGYLPDYSKLQTIKEQDGQYQQRWTSRKLSRKVAPLKPTGFFIKPVIYYPQLEQHAQFDVHAATQLSLYINQQIKTTFAKHYPVVDTIEPGVFIVEPAITSVRISLEDLSPLEVIPFKALIASINYATGGRDRDVEIRLETKISQQKNNELLAMTVHGGHAFQLENDQEKLTKEHIKELINNWTVGWDRALIQYKSKNNIKN